MTPIAFYRDVYVSDGSDFNECWVVYDTIIVFVFCVDFKGAGLGVVGYGVVRVAGVGGRGLAGYAVGMVSSRRLKDIVNAIRPAMPVRSTGAGRSIMTVRKGPSAC